ncbi:hypothetical protein MNBD_GAMMA16-1258 [hydrothermal vent metagenome]|uniref:Uncharacterized protein n=1 Tax=hydrothermal vent metagenome TaxID=652676 RepID=A0A3B0ZKC2_9ZZZZ
MQTALHRQQPLNRLNWWSNKFLKTPIFVAQVELSEPWGAADLIQKNQGGSINKTTLLCLKNRQARREKSSLLIVNKRRNAAWYFFSYNSKVP